MKKKNILIIGAGNSGKVVAHKCSQYSHLLGDINLASRTIEKCNLIIKDIEIYSNSVIIYNKHSFSTP